jgi:hypothetical protein
MTFQGKKVPVSFFLEMPGDINIRNVLAEIEVVM